MEEIKELEKIVREASDVSFSSEIEIWSYALNTVSKAIRAQSATYFSADEERKFLTFETVIGPKSEELKGISFSYEGAAGWCAGQKKAVLIKDVSNNPLFTVKVDYASGYKTKSIIALPCFCASKLSGVAEFINPAEKDSFEEKDFSFAYSVFAFFSKIAYIHKLEFTLKELSSRADYAVNNLSGGFIGADLDEKIIFFNPKAEQILSVKSQAGKSISLSDMPAEIKEALYKTLREKTQIKRAETSILAAGQSRKIGYSTITLKTVDGQINGAGIIFQDITSI